MIEKTTGLKGEFDFFTRQLTEREKKLFGIFISHSSADNEKYLFPLLKAMKEANLYPICDRDILEGGDDFQKVIEEYIDCYAGVVIITKNSLSSDWVNYETGTFAANNMPVYLWDPENLLTPYLNEKDKQTITSSTNYHMTQYLPAYTELDEFVRILADISPYPEMFQEEYPSLSKAKFLSIIKKSVETIMLTIESEMFNNQEHLFKNCSFRTLIVNFGMFHDDHGDGHHCYARNYTLLEEDKCIFTKQACALVGQTDINESNCECVVLNYYTNNGNFFNKGLMTTSGEIAETSCIMFYVPVHKIFGVEFKFIIEVNNDEQYEELFELLNIAGFNPTCSDSLNTGRIYLSLPDRRGQGLFRLHNEFSNNFLCPYCTRNE